MARNSGYGTTPEIPSRLIELRVSPVMAIFREEGENSVNLRLAAGFSFLYSAWEEDSRVSHRSACDPA